MMRYLTFIYYLNQTKIFNETSVIHHKHVNVDEFIRAVLLCLFITDNDVRSVLRVS